MKSIDAPEFLTFYLLIQQSSTSLYFSPAGTTISQPSFGAGFYTSRDDAEKARTLAILGDKSDASFHIFELDFPNPAYKGG